MLISPTGFFVDGRDVILVVWNAANNAKTYHLWGVYG